MINVKHTIDCTHSAISNHKDIGELSRSVQNSQYPNADSERIFVWDGFGKEISAKLFENNDWPQNFVGLFSNQEMWPWKFRFDSSDPDRLGNQDLLEAIGPLSNNIIASLRIRDFESDDSFQGSPEWFEEVIPYLNDEFKESKMLINHIIQSLYAASEVGISLFLEKISLIISSNPDNPVTLTPHLHRDGAYGQLESAAVSFYSESLTPHSSTLFFPNFDFESASSLKPITAKKIHNLFPNTLAYSISSGSLAIFSGKLASDGSKSDLRGALHMSPEGFFPTRRLLLLFKSKISD